MQSIVIGGQGFLGQAIVRELQARGGGIRVVDFAPPPEYSPVPYTQADIRSHEDIRDAIGGADEVYHIAGVLGTSELNGAIGDAIDVNIGGTVNVFRACCELGIRRVFYPAKPNCWLNTYTVTKQAAEQFAELFNVEHDMEIVRLRWFNAFGPGQHTHPVRKQIPTWCLCARFGLPIPVFGNGHNCVDLIHSSDVARWTVEATRAGLTDEVYDLGRGEPLSVLYVAEGLNFIAGSSAGVSYHPMRPGETEPTEIVADIAPLRAALDAKGSSLGFAGLADTLAETYRWYRDMPEQQARAAMVYHGLMS